MTGPRTHQPTPLTQTVYWKPLLWLLALAPWAGFIAGWWLDAREHRSP